MDRQVEVVINFETGLHQLDQPAEDQGVGTASDELWSARMAIAELTSKSGGRSSGLEPKGVEEHIEADTFMNGSVACNKAIICTCEQKPQVFLISLRLIKP